VQDGDLLVATEGGATLVAVHCQLSCTVIPVIATATKAHGEGHLAFTMGPAPSSPVGPSAIATPAGGLSSQLAAFAGEWGMPAIAFLLLVALVAAVGLQAAVRRRRR